MSSSTGAEASASSARDEMVGSEAISASGPGRVVGNFCDGGWLYNFRERFLHYSPVRPCCSPHSVSWRLCEVTVGCRGLS